MPYPPNGYPAQGGNLYPPTNPPNFDQMAFVQQQVNYLFFFFCFLFDFNFLFHSWNNVRMSNWKNFMRKLRILCYKQFF